MPGANADSSIATRGSLLNRLKDWNDHDSWTTFIETYSRLVYSVALQAGLTTCEAQEVVQETFIGVAKKIHDFKYNPAVGSFKGWLLHTTRWRIADQFRKRARTAAAAPAGCTVNGHTAAIERIPDPASLKLEQCWETEWEKALFEAALERVRPKVNSAQYQLFDLYVLKHWPVLKIARTLRVNIGRIYLAKHRISSLIRKEIELLRETVV